MLTKIETTFGRAPHILNASSSLVGFSFVLLSTIRLLGVGKSSFLDEIAGLEILLFCISSLFSFLSLRQESEAKALFYEGVADYVFLTGLGVLLVAAVMLLFVLT